MYLETQKPCTRMTTVYVFIARPVFSFYMHPFRLPHQIYSCKLLPSTPTHCVCCPSHAVLSSWVSCTVQHADNTDIAAITNGDRP